MNDVNLLPKKLIVPQRYQKLQQIYRLASIAVLSIIVLCSVSFFILTITSPLSAAKAKEQTLTRQLSALDSKITRVVVLHDRLLNIDKVLKTRSLAHERIANILTATPKSISISSLQASEKEVIVGAQATSLRDIDTVITNFSNVVKKDQSFKRLTLDSLFYDQEGREFVASFTLALQ